MSTISPTQPIQSPNLSEWIPTPLFRMSLEQYEAMVDSGAFTEHDRFHLINGFLVAKMTQGDPHCVADDLCRNALTSVLPPRWFVPSEQAGETSAQKQAGTRSRRCSRRDSRLRPSLPGPGGRWHDRRNSIQ